MTDNIRNGNISCIDVSATELRYINHSYDLSTNDTEINPPFYQSRRDSLLFDIVEHQKTWSQSDIENAGRYSKQSKESSNYIGMKR